MHATIDHVAVAVPDLARAEKRWIGTLGGTRVSGPHTTDVFTNEQIAFANGARLELIQPTTDVPSTNFVRRFLERSGAGLQHLTLLVGDLAEALAELRGAGFDVVDVQDTHEGWNEAFLRPSQVGGLVVQIAWVHPDHRAPTPRPAPGAAATLLGPTLRHPDLAHVERLWTLLGAQVVVRGDTVVASWPGAPLTVVIERGESAGPVGLRFADAPALATDPVAGAAVLPAVPSDLVVTRAGQGDASALT